MKIRNPKKKALEAQPIIPPFDIDYDDSKINEVLPNNEQPKQRDELPQPEPLPDYDKRFKKIHDYIINCNPDDEWEVISKWLNKKPNSIHDVIQMLNEHPEMKTRSRRLALMAEREFSRFEFGWKDRTQVLRELARDYWEQRKEQGMRKQITNDMIDDWIIENYGSVYKEMHTRLQDMKNVSTLMGKMADQLDVRDADFRKMLDKMSTKDGTEPAWFGSQEKRRKHE